MSMTVPKVIEFETRLLLPFLFEHSKINQVAEHILQVQSMGQSIWRRDVMDAAYTDNLLPYLRQFREHSSDQDYGCYLVLEPHALRNLLRPIVVPDTQAEARLIQRHGAEVFLSPYGVAVFSLSIGASNCELDVENVREFNRRMHFGKEWEEQAPERLIAMESDLDDLLQGVLRTPSLISQLLGGLISSGAVKDQLGIAELKRSLNVYTVMRFPATVDFGMPDTRRVLQNDLIGAASLWPTNHCGIVDDRPDSTLLLNNKHWSAVSSIGVAHFVADQARDATGDHPFNERRVKNAADKLFFQYLHGILQRLAMHAFSHEAIGLTHDASKLRSTEFLMRLAPLKQTLIHFSLRGRASQLSEEVTATQFYEHCCQVLNLEMEFQRLDKSIAEAESVLKSFEVIAQTEGVRATLEEQIRLHEKVEWIEVIIVVVYSVEFAHLLGDSFFPHDPNAHVTSWIYPGMSLCAVATLTLLAMMSAQGLLAHAGEHHELKSNRTPNSANWIVGGLISWASRISQRLIGGKRRWALVWIVAAILLHLVAGWATSGTH